MFPHKHYFIRHAHRDAFDPNDWGHDISITSQGQESSRQFGRALARSRIETIWTSPIRRCIQTAEEIKKGFGIDVPNYSSSLLGDPGFMILDPKLAENAFQKYQLVEIVELLLGGKSIPGFCSVNIGCSRILRKLSENKHSNQIWVSHDINICILACWVFQRTHSENMMPGFLEGIEFSFDEIDILLILGV